MLLSANIDQEVLMPLQIKVSPEIVKLGLLPAEKLDEMPEAKAQLAALPAQIAAIEPIIQSAMAQLDAANAWPSHAFAAYHIELDFGAEIETKWGGIDISAKSRDRTISISAEHPLRISIGVELITAPFFLALQQSNQFAPSEVCAILLGHETFHLTEADRMSSSKVRLGKHLSGFAAAMHPDFSDDWLVAMRALSEDFWGYRTKKNPYVPRNTLAIWKSSDIASEACADIFALQFMPKSQQKSWMAALIALRQSQEVTGAATVVDSSNLAAENPDYQIGAVLTKHAPLLIKQNRWTVRETMWREAFNAALLETTYLTFETKSKIMTALQSPARKPNISAPTSLWGRLLSRKRK